MKFRGYFLGLLCLVACSKTAPRRPINKIKGQQKEYSIALNKAIHKHQEKLTQEYVHKDSLHTYINSSFDFVYTQLFQSKNTNFIHPKKGDKVTFLKTVYSLKDELIYPEQKQIIEIGKSREIKGIVEGLKLMKEDEEIKFIFTSFVAHGFNGDKNRIGRNTPLIVKIKLLTIN